MSSTNSLREAEPTTGGSSNPDLAADRKASRRGLSIRAPSLGDRSTDTTGLSQEARAPSRVSANGLWVFTRRILQFVRGFQDGRRRQVGVLLADNGTVWRLFHRVLVRRLSLEEQETHDREEQHSKERKQGKARDQSVGVPGSTGSAGLPERSVVTALGPGFTASTVTLGAAA